MASIPNIDPVPLTCRHCGSRLENRLFLKEDEAYCCESCFLGARRQPQKSSNGRDRYTDFVEILAETLDLREHETGLHSKRVACHTQVLAQRFFAGDHEALRQIYWGSLLHDIGKIGVPDAILLKQGPLTEAEWVVMQAHVKQGYEIVSRLPGMAEAAEIVLCHEEHFDGTGYPRALKGDRIPFGARLFAVVDTLDAMTSDRSYRKGLGFDDAKAEIVRLAGVQFDPIAVEAFLAEEGTLRDMVDLKCTRP